MDFAVRISFFTLLLIASVKQSFSQNSIKWIFDEKASSAISENIPEGKALLIFESPVDLKFDSSIENLEQPGKKMGKYYLYVNTGPQAITIKYYGNYDINFGILQASGSLPALKNKEIKYFRISEIRNLVCEDITEAEIAKGNNGVPIGANVSDALVIINVYPPDLDIQITNETKAITKQSRADQNYMVFVKAPGNQNLYIKYTGFTDKEISVKNLSPKETRFYRIIKLSDLSDYSKQTGSDNKNEEADYSKILGYWGGSLGETETQLDLRQGPESGKVIGKIFQNGTYSSISGLIRQKSSDEFRMTLNQQPNNTGGEGATLDLIFKKGIGNGVSVTDQGKIQDMTLMKVKSLPTIDNLEKTQPSLSLKKQVEGNYNATLNNLFTSISINSLEIQNKLKGTVNLVDGRKCNLNGILSEKSGFLSLVLNFQDDCGTCAGTLILKLNDGKAGGFFTSNDGSINFNVVFSGPARL